MSGCALGVDGFVRVHPVRPGAPCELLGSMGFVEFVRLHLAGRLVSFGSCGSPVCAIGVARVCHVRPVVP